MTYIPRSSSSIPDSVGSIPTLVRKKRTFRVFHILASVLFALSIVGAVGVFLFGHYSEGKLDEARIALEKASSSDDATRVEGVGTFNQRLETARMLLDQHLSPLRVFEKFEKMTKETVQVTRFSYEYEPGFEATLGFSVNAAQLSSIALQRLGLAASTIFSEFTMRDIAMESDTESDDEEAEEVSGVTADFAGVLDTAQFTYDPVAGTPSGTVPATVETGAQVENDAATSTEATTTDVITE
jgi:hypothetical protein